MERMASPNDETELESILVAWILASAYLWNDRGGNGCVLEAEDRTIKCSSRCADFGRRCRQDSFRVTRPTRSQWGASLEVKDSEPWQRPFGVIVLLRWPR